MIHCHILISGARHVKFGLYHNLRPLLWAPESIAAPHHPSNDSVQQRLVIE